MGSMAFAHDLDNLGASTQHVLHTVARMSEDDWRGPSLLPDWSRAHVVAHLVLNAEGFARAIEGLVRGQEVPIYDSQESRDGDIAELSGRPRSLVRERLEESTARLATALSSLGTDQLTSQVDRLPGGPAAPVEGIPSSRRCEVEVHHGDLDAGYTAADWPADFCAELLDVLTSDRAGQGPFTVVATDLGRSWTVGEAGSDNPKVRGTAGDLGWWLAGRGDGAGLRAEDGDLPVLGRWR